MIRAPGRALLALAAALAPVLAGCSRQSDGPVFNGFGISIFASSDLVPPGSLKSPGNAYITLENRQGGAGAYGFVTSPFDLWAPFRWEVKGGQIEPGSPGPGTGFFCTELDVRGSSPLEFYALCAQKNGGGYQCWLSRAGVGNTGITQVNATGMVEFAVEHTGTNLLFQVKKPSDPKWTTIATVPHTQGEALVPSIGFAQAPALAQADFDNPRVVFNGPLPGGSDAERVLARVVMDAGMPVSEAARDVDLGDLEEAADHLEDAAAALAAAATAVDAGKGDLIDPKAGAKAAKKVKAAVKGIGKVGKSFEKGKTYKSVALGILKVLRDVHDAMQLLDPHGLPGGG
ncbi:MAG: hypothetical protein HUU06_03995 [Planctomycetaceae bacterium]|nr:hypothetical protein [Planctomycetota bacterium]NUN51939.1 hypothetical protein [Planctomycetaceae bacterium]